MADVVVGCLLLAWGLWCLCWAPRLTAGYLRRFAEAGSLTDDVIDAVPSPVGWRLGGCLWCALGVWGMVSAFAR